MVSPVSEITRVLALVKNHKAILQWHGLSNLFESCYLILLRMLLVCALHNSECVYIQQDAGILMFNLIHHRLLDSFLNDFSFLSLFYFFPVLRFMERQIQGLVLQAILVRCYTFFIQMYAFSLGFAVFSFFLVFSLACGSVLTNWITNRSSQQALAWDFNTITMTSLATACVERRHFPWQMMAS